VADNGVGDDRLGDSARAASDGQGSRSSDSVGLGAVSDQSSFRAVGGVMVNDPGVGSDVLGPGVGANGSGDKRNGVLHFVGWYNSKSWRELKIVID